MFLFIKSYHLPIGGWELLKENKLVTYKQFVVLKDPTSLISVVRATYIHQHGIHFT